MAALLRGRSVNSAC